MNPTHTMPSAPDVGDPTPADILRCAALYLIRHGWHQGDMFTNPLQPTPAACAIGAIRMAVCGTPTSLYTGDQARQVGRAITLLAGHLHDTGRIPDGDHHCPLCPDDQEIIGDWNDEDDRTAAEVITALTDAADDWDHTHGGAR